MEKHDFSDRSHDQPAPAKPSLLTRLLVPLGGANTETAVKYCTKQELGDFKVRGAVLLGSAAFVAMSSTTLLHIAAGDGQFHPLLVLVGAGIATLQGLTDLVTQNKGTLYAKGLAEHRTVGLKLPEPARAIFVSRYVRLAR